MANRGIITQCCRLLPAESLSHDAPDPREGKAQEYDACVTAA